MRSLRARNLLLAAVLALVAVAATLVYASHTKPQPAAASDGVRVLVAVHDIAVGTTGDRIVADSLARFRIVSRADEATDAVVDASQLRGLVATAAIYRGEQVTSRRLGTAARQGLRATLRGALRLVQVPGDDDQLLAGTLRDGDVVDVVASIRQPESGSTHFARIVLRDILVVAAAKPSSGSAVDGKAPDSITLQLTDEQAQRLFWVEKNADWALLLRPVGNASSTLAPAITGATLVGGAQ